MPLPAIYTNDDAARAHLEALLWPKGPVCPRCKTNDQERIAKLQGKSTRPGVYKCRDCRKPFTVTVGTIFERSHIPLHQWVYATHLLNSSKKGLSAHQLKRMLKVDYKSAWFLNHRIREAMRPLGLEPMGGDGEIVEADETYQGKTEQPRVSKQRKGRPYNPRGSRGPKDKRPILSLIHRGGRVRSFHIASADKETVQRIVSENVKRESRLHTDESRLYVGIDMASHETVRHSAKEYVRGDVHTNSAEGYFSIFKRGMKGVYQHCKEKHLHRYLSEFDHRYNYRIALGYNDDTRRDITLQGAIGKRLTYKGINPQVV